MPLITRPKNGRVKKTALDHLAAQTPGEVEALAATARAALMAATVTERTKEQYEGRVNLLSEVLNSLNEKRVANGLAEVPWSLKIFTIFLHHMLTAGMGVSAPGYLNAILFVQRSGSFGTWALEGQDELRRLVKGAVYDGGARRNKARRAQMTFEMFQSFEEWMMDNEKPPSLILAMRLTFGGALRISECLRLRRKDVQISKEHDVILDLPNKAYKAGNGKPPRVQKTLTEFMAIDAVLVASEGKGLEDYIFPPSEWNERTARRAVKDWAEVHAFEFLDNGLDNVFIDGVHCLRHGGMALIKDKVVAAMGKAFQGELGACSAQNVDRYAVPNHKRGPKKRSRS